MVESVFGCAVLVVVLASVDVVFVGSFLCSVDVLVGTMVVEVSVECVSVVLAVVDVFPLFSDELVVVDVVVSVAVVDGTSVFSFGVVGCVGFVVVGLDGFPVDVILLVGAVVVV